MDYYEILNSTAGIVIIIVAFMINRSLLKYAKIYRIDGKKVRNVKAFISKVWNGIIHGAVVGAFTGTIYAGTIYLNYLSFAISLAVYNTIYLIYRRKTLITRSNTKSQLEYLISNKIIIQRILQNESNKDPNNQVLLNCLEAFDFLDRKSIEEL